MASRHPVCTVVVTVSVVMASTTNADQPDVSRRRSRTSPLPLLNWNPLQSGSRYSKVADADAQPEGEGSTDDAPLCASVNASRGAAAKRPKRSCRHRVLVLGACLVVGLLASTLGILITWVQNDQLREQPASFIVSLTVVFGLFLGLIAHRVQTVDPRPNPAVAEIAPAPGQHGKGFRPPRPVDTLDDELAHALTPAQWREVAYRLRRRLPWRLARRILMFPVIAVAIGVTLFLALVKGNDVLPDASVFLGASGIGVLFLWLAIAVHGIVNLCRGPMLLVRGTVARTGVAMPEDGTGFTPTGIVLVDPRFHVLSREGALTDSAMDKHRDLLHAVAANDARPRRVSLRCSGRLAKRLLEGGRTAVLCLGDDRAVALLRDLVGRGDTTAVRGSARP